MTKEISLLNIALQFSIVESSFLKSQAFMSVQIVQHMTIMSFITNGTLSCLLICLTALCGLNHEGTCTPISSQQFFAKVHLKNRCLSFYSFYNKQRSQVQNSSCMFSLSSSPLVFSLSCNNSQKDTLCFCW
jgi:hypothetical protein